MNPSRLALARKRRRLTKVALARLVNLSPRSLSSYESGVTCPPREILEALADALRFPVSFFSRPDVEELPADGASFRALKSMTAGQRDAALAAGALAVELNRWITDQFTLPSADLPDLRDCEPEDAARVLRVEWGIGVLPIGNMVHLLESKGIRVFSLAERAKQVDAYSLWHAETPFVFLNTMKTPEHGRMDAAHELGHLVLHRHGGTRNRGRDVEKDAQRFGAAFLMPEDSIRTLVRRPILPTMPQLIQLKRNWKVSVAALARRLHVLGLLSDWSYRGVNVELSRYGRSREPGGVTDRETSQVLDRVFSHLKQRGILKSSVAQDLGLHVADLELLIFGLSPMTRSRRRGSCGDREAVARRARMKLVP
ncbi:MAG: XRE family transcriptional regulator [Acidobacteria bacterium]|nr:XRE family transcriptional regulator [Acidobacteriota bacterium]